MLDPSSLYVLTFVARRLSPDPVLLLAATRTMGGDAFADAGLPELILRPLGEPTSAALIDVAAPGLDPALRPQVLALSEGNRAHLARHTAEELAEALRHPVEPWQSHGWRLLDISLPHPPGP